MENAPFTQAWFFGEWQEKIGRKVRRFKIKKNHGDFFEARISQARMWDKIFNNILDKIEKFSKMCGAEIPREIREAIARFGDDQASIMKFGIEYATRQCEELLRGGVPGLHFYTLNQSRATRQIYANLHLADKD